MSPTPLTNVQFTSPLDFEGHGHRPNLSSDSTSASDGISGRQGGGSISNSRLLRKDRCQLASDISTQPRYSYTQRRRKWMREMHTRTKRTWRRYVRLGLTVTVIGWVVYCTIRYFIAVRIYRGDHVRSRYALGMGITSAFTILFFASETSMTLRFFNNHFDRRLRVIVHSLAYLSSTLVLGLTIINIVLVNIWRTPHNASQFGRSIQGRCHWDIDVVWSGTGMVCAQKGAKPFGDWLGAAICRLALSAMLVTAYHLTVYGYPSVCDTKAPPSDVDDETSEAVERRPSMPITRSPLRSSHVPETSLVPIAITVSEDEHQRRSLSFTAAGQVLSRIEGSELDPEDDRDSSTSSSPDQYRDFGESVQFEFDDDCLPPPRTDSPEALSFAEGLNVPRHSTTPSYLPQPTLDSYAESGGLARRSPPSSYLRTIAAPVNDLHEVASAFQSLVSDFTQETQDGMTLSRVTRPPLPTVRVLGSNISRMSTIDSMASREAGSIVRSPSRSDTPLSHGSESRNLSRDASVSRRPRNGSVATSYHDIGSSAEQLPS